MPPKRSKVGRPRGSKNRTKKTVKRNGKIKIEVDVDTLNILEDEDSRQYFGTSNVLSPQKTQGPKLKVQYSCQECNKKFKFKQSFNNHCKNEHSKLPNAVACDQCYVRCPDNETLELHIQSVHERQVFKCPHCTKPFIRHAHVLRHLMQSGCDGKGVSLYPCEICNAKFSRKDNLQVHLRQQHILRKVYSCKHCNGFYTKNFSKLIRHWQDKHIDPPTFECEHCGRTTGSRAAMSKHLEIHGERSHKCDVCGYSTFTSEVLRRHVLTHVINKPYKCSICDQSYIQRSQLRRHLEKHSGNMCIECHRTFQTKAKLLIHMREHQGLTKLYCPFNECPYSKKEFSNELGLRSHLKNHVNSKPFKCEVCQKEYHSQLNMRRHMATHRLDRPRRCMYCVAARAYIRGEQLLRHVRKLHPAIFKQHLVHVRQVLGTNVGVERVRKSELESILNVLDAESDRIIEGYSDKGVLYGGMQDEDEKDVSSEIKQTLKLEDKPLMSEEDLEENLRTLLSRLIDRDTLEYFGWPDESIDVVLKAVIEQCGARAADSDKWTRVQCLRENTKHLFLYVVEDKNIARMLDTHTIDQIVKHIIAQVDDSPSTTIDKL